MWQGISDFIVFLGWLWENIATIFGNVFLPVRYIFSFLQQLVLTAFSTPPELETIWGFSTSTMAIFQAIPYWNIICTSLISAVFLIFILFILKTFLKA